MYRLCRLEIVVVNRMVIRRCRDKGSNEEGLIVRARKPKIS